MPLVQFPAIVEISKILKKSVQIFKKKQYGEKLQYLSKLNTERQNCLLALAKKKQGNGMTHYFCTS